MDRDSIMGVDVIGGKTSLLCISSDADYYPLLIKHEFVELAQQFLQRISYSFETQVKHKRRPREITGRDERAG